MFLTFLFYLCGVTHYLGRLWDSVNSWVGDFKLDSGILVNLSVIIASFITITIPIALGVVSNYANDYGEPEFARAFLDDWRYKIQKAPVLLIAALCIVLQATSLGNSGWFNLILVLSDLVAIIFFIRFIVHIEHYTIGFEQNIEEDLMRKGDAIF
ncbi:MAG TPA: hypothetical protein PLV21_03890 [Cyclobacteriaceae bacterium]|nr:hypothetical protein [Cyclobacteriaceae bacterium]HRJ81001.1 hypothetical protein [Cyclobacteriaceae bacterium]